MFDILIVVGMGKIRQRERESSEEMEVEVAQVVSRKKKGIRKGEHKNIVKTSPNQQVDKSKQAQR